MKKRRQFTDEQQLTGVTKAIESLRRKQERGESAPVWLIPSLERRRRDLELRTRTGKRARRSSRSFLDRVLGR